MNIIGDELKLKNDLLALLLIEKIKEIDINNSIIYYNFPFYRGESKDDLIQAHVLLISQDYGVISFRCLNSKKDFNENEKKKLEDLDSHIFSKINKFDQFRKSRRELKINVTPIIFIYSEEQLSSEDFVSLVNLKSFIFDNEKDKLNKDEFNLLISIIEGTVHLRNKKDRELDNDNTSLTKGRILSIIQNKHAVFDIEQKKAALNILDVPQRIRGLAGSGKTIILTMKAALFHLQNPDAEILYTYFTKALFGQIKYFIEKYYRDFSDNKEPDWNKIHILHGWGGSGLSGVYSDACFENGSRPIKFFEAKMNDPRNPFNYACKNIEALDLKQKYDLTLIDEGQDFPIYFYRLCRKITKNNRIVWAYDDFQNIFDVTIQDEKETFGKDENDEYYIDFSKSENKLQDISLEKCYRNSRITLLNAFSLGLGIYNDKVLQRLENNKHWEELGFVVENGNSKDNSKMTISRPEANSPLEYNEFFKEDVIKIKVFDDINKESLFISEEIIKDIKEQNLLPDDICVICLDLKHISDYFRLIENELNLNGIQAFNLINAPNNNTYFNIKNHVTLSTLNKAKGNETGMVYIIGTDSVFVNKDYIIDRNKLFTAITRSKGWVYITGFDRVNICENEMNELKKNEYKLIFVQPSKSKTRTILRNITKEQNLIEELNKKIEKISKETGLSNEEIISKINKKEKNVK